MSKRSARRPGKTSDDAWEKIFEAPIEPAMPVLVDQDDDDDGDDVSEALIDPEDDGDEVGMPAAWLELDTDNEQENDK
ncbi:MAG TPA: hypothetical protein VF800_02940 [Telluria sp.]|jgi:hypothetical protein